MATKKALSAEEVSFRISPASSEFLLLPWPCCLIAAAPSAAEVTLLARLHDSTGLQIAAMKEADRLEGERKAKERADFVKAHDTVNGLTDAQAQERITQYGYNVLDEKKRCVAGGADAGAGPNAQKALLAAQNAGVRSAGVEIKAAVFVSAATARSRC